MVRSVPSRGGRPLSPSAPTRRQLQQERADSSAPPDSKQAQPIQADPTPLSARAASLERRRALTTSGKAAVLAQGTLGAGRVRTSQDKKGKNKEDIHKWKNKGTRIIDVKICIKCRYKTARSQK
jgi:hypothetical protein